jgi:hypothetical protein
MPNERPHVDMASEITRLRAENERLREWVRNAAQILASARSRNEAVSASSIADPELELGAGTALGNLADRFSRIEGLLDNPPPPREAPPRKPRKTSPRTVPAE